MATPLDWTERNEKLAAMLSRVAMGDRAAFATLYQASSGHLFGVILRINSDRAQAEELLQDIFVNIWRAAQGYDAAKAQPMTWLTSIARNRAIDSLRRRRSEVPTVTSKGSDDDSDDLLANVPSDDKGPLGLLLQAAERRDLANCVGALSAEQQQCVALAFYQGLSHAEVAEHMARPLGSVKSWVRRALASLKSCLDRLPSAAPSTTTRAVPEGKG
jgi:RNA polymerase sigma-70 factor (ECF subfamily)